MLIILKTMGSFYVSADPMGTPRIQVVSLGINHIQLHCARWRTGKPDREEPKVNAGGLGAVFEVGKDSSAD